MQKSAGPPTGRGDEATPSSSNYVMYRNAKPRPRPHCQNGISPALQTTNDPTGKLPEQSEKVLCRQWIRAAVMETISPNQSLPKIAPYPTEPAASGDTWRSGMGAERGGNRKLYPVHDWKNSSHHDKSK